MKLFNNFCRDEEMLRALHYEEDIAIARALITHLQVNSGGVSYTSDYPGGEGESPSSSSINLDVPEAAVSTSSAAVATSGTASARDSAVDQKPGEFLRKKDTEEEVLVPAKWRTVVRRKSKREKKRTTVSVWLATFSAWQLHVGCIPFITILSSFFRFRFQNGSTSTQPYSNSSVILAFSLLPHMLRSLLSSRNSRRNW